MNPTPMFQGLDLKVCPIGRRRLTIDVSGLSTRVNILNQLFRQNMEVAALFFVLVCAVSCCASDLLRGVGRPRVYF